MTHHNAGHILDLSQAARVEPLDIAGMIITLWRGKWVILLSTVAMLLLAGYYAFAIASPRYAATTTLHVDTNRFAITENGVSSAGGTGNLNTEVAILRSRHLLEQVVDTLNLQTDPAFNRYLTPVAQWSITGLRNQMRDWLSGSTTPAPDQAAIRAKTVENLRNTISIQTQRDSAVLSITATTGKSETAATIANTLADLYLVDQINTQFSTSETAVTWLSEKVFELQIELAEKENAITELIARAQIGDEATLDAISRQAIETDNRLQEARAALTKLDDGTQVSATGTSLSADSQQLSNQIAALELYRANLSAQLADQSASLAQLQHLRREADATRVLYETFLSRLQDVSLQSGLSAPRSRILNIAEPGTYVAPRKMLILAMAGLLGVAVGIMLAVLQAARRTGIRTADALADATGLPVMAQLPAKWRKKPPVKDAARTLRAAVLLQAAEDSAQTILCTSGLVDDGQKDTAFLLGQALHDLGRSVLVFDGDLRNSKANGDLNAIIKGAQDGDAMIHSDRRWGVDVLRTHAGNAHPADLFCSRNFNMFLNRMRERYDHIIIAAPPVLPAPDTLVLAQHSDAVIYAVQCDRTKPETIRAGQQALEGAQAPITGFVLTGVDIRKQKTAGASIWPSGKAHPIGAATL
ncbi:Wzz/FepE/Etk N-terminal domain-containing protein [Yoonia sp. BS5-3]|uniref:GumC family protein n=1 Tax=Yoonia phaeophyticola TaxID=3137369 RepID=A0ABZ2V2L5_9RHOB